MVSQSTKDGVKEWFSENKFYVALSLIACVVLEICLFLDILPTYSSTPLQEKARYFFPVWVIIGIAYLALTNHINDVGALQAENPVD